MNISLADAIDLVGKWQSEKVIIWAFFRIDGIRGNVKGPIVVEDGWVAVLAPSWAGTFELKMSEMVSIEYIESREWPSPPDEDSGPPPISTLILDTSGGFHAELNELVPGTLPRLEYPS
jgi:hypothetical protein